MYCFSLFLFFLFFFLLVSSCSFFLFFFLLYLLVLSSYYLFFFLFFLFLFSFFFLLVFFVTRLQDLVRTIPQFVYKRQDWSIIHPNVDTSNDEVADLVASGGAYVAGFTDNSVAIREDLYDLLVDVDGGSVSYASHAQSSFGMGKIHKEIAMYMVEAADDETVSQRDFLKTMMAKSDLLLEGLNKLATPSEDDESRLVVSIEAIRARKMPKAMHAFLYNLAVAEGMVDN